MKITRKRVRALLSAVAIAGIASIGLAACTTSGTSSSTASSSGGTVTIAEVNEVTSFNQNTPQGNLDTNGQIFQLTAPQFYTLDQNYKVIPNTDIGTYKKISDNPLKVKYTLKKGLKWSDGQPITADDMLLAWAENSGYYDSATVDGDGNVTKGTQYFTTALGKVMTTSYPTVSSDNLSLTYNYTTPYVDWALVNAIFQPAHIVAKEAGVSTAELTKAFKDTKAGDTANPAAPNPTLVKAAKFVNTGYDATSLPSNKDLLVSGGQFKVTAWAPKQSMTLTKNPDYPSDGKEAVKFNKLVIRFIGDAGAQVTALQNGEVDAIQPQASADTLKALKAATGTTILTGSQAAYDHLDLNFKSSVFSDPTVRQAFLLTVPRQQILDSIITPVNPKAQVLNSQIFLPQQSAYAADVKDNGSSAYNKVDIAKAKELLAGKTPTVKILYNTANPNRVATFQAIQASAKEAGITVTDGGSPNWSSLLAGGDYDASIFGWINPGAGTAQIPQLFQIGNPSNYNNYNNQQASDLANKTQTTLSTSELVDQEKQIDKLAFADAYGLPLFQLPGIFAHNKRVSGIGYFGGQTGLVWNVWDWKVK